MTKKPLHKQISGSLRNRILRLEIKPGERILEQNIADEFDTSRGPVREAMRQLEQEGLLEYRYHGGCIVRDLKQEDASEVFFVRASLECTSLEYCKGVIAPEILEEMEVLLCQLRDAAWSGDFKLFIAKNERFHALIMEASGLRRLRGMWESLASVGAALFLPKKNKNTIMRRQYSRVARTYEALRAGEIKKAQKHIYGHYLKTGLL